MADQQLAPSPSRGPDLGAEVRAPVQPPVPPVDPAAGRDPGRVAAPPVDLRDAKFKAPTELQEQTALALSRQAFAYEQRVDVVRRDGVVVRDSGTFHKTQGEASGGYFSDAGGTRYHITGTTQEGSVIARHSVDPTTGAVVMNPSQGGPRVYSREVMDVISQLGLQQLQDGGLEYSRPGYSGKYKIQIEKDGTFSVHYSGGRNAGGERCYAQTFHHGEWDAGRGGSLWNNRDQQSKWDKWSARENGDATAVAAAHSEPVARAGSGFHSATRSSTADPATGIVSRAAAPALSAPLQERVKTITDNPETWSGTYVSIPGAEGKPATVPASYSFACQYKGESGILTVKQSTLDQADIPAVVRSTYSLAVNHNNEATPDGQGYRSLLTDVKMLLKDGGRETVVVLKPNGDVVDVTNNNIFRIQANDGEPIRWVQEAFKGDTAQTGTEGAGPNPSRTPDLNGTADPGTPRNSTGAMTADQLATIRTSNIEALDNIATELITANSLSGMYVDSRVTAPTKPEERTATAAAVKVTDLDEETGNTKSAYVFTRTIRDKDNTLKPGTFFVNEADLTQSKEASVQIVRQTYEAKTNPETGEIKIEDWHHIDTYTQTRIRSDGSVEMQKFPPGQAGEFSIIAPHVTSDGLQWRVIEAELKDGRAEPKGRTAPVPPAVEAPTTSQTTNPTSSNYNAEEVARKMYAALSGILNDDEEAFVSLVENAKAQGKLNTVNDSLFKNLNYTIKSLIASEGFTSAQTDRLNAALEGYDDTPTTKYSPPTSYTPPGPIRTGY